MLRSLGQGRKEMRRKSKEGDEWIRWTGDENEWVRCRRGDRSVEKSGAKERTKKGGKWEERQEKEEKKDEIKKMRCTWKKMRRQRSKRRNGEGRGGGDGERWEGNKIGERDKKEDEF